LTLPGSFQVLTMLELAAPELADAAALDDVEVEALTDEADPDELLAAGDLAELQAATAPAVKIINAITKRRPMSGTVSGLPRVVLVNSVRRTPSHSVVVTAVAPVTPRMRRITLRAPSLVGLTTTPAQDVELILADGTGHRAKRRYTIRNARPGLGEIDIDALVHPHGIGGRWAESAAVGDEFDLLGPRGHLELRPADWHLFVGDEAGLPAIAALLEALDEPATVLAEVGDRSDEIELGRADGADVTWLHRGDEPPGGSAMFATALAAISPRSNGRAYLLGESRAMVALRPAIEALGIPADRAYVKGYWNLGRGARRIPGS
jgi:NADPH-dependent ferric siderophore reductase